MGTHPIFESDFDCLTEIVDAVIFCLTFSFVPAVLTASRLHRLRFCARKWATFAHA